MSKEFEIQLKKNIFEFEFNRNSQYFLNSITICLTVVGILIGFTNLPPDKFFGDSSIIIILFLISIAIASLVFSIYNYKKSREFRLKTIKLVKNTIPSFAIDENGFVDKLAFLLKNPKKGSNQLYTKIKKFIFK